MSQLSNRREPNKKKKKITSLLESRKEKINKEKDLENYTTNINITRSNISYWDKTNFHEREKCVVNYKNFNLKIKKFCEIPAHGTLFKFNKTKLESPRNMDRQKKKNFKKMSENKEFKKNIGKNVRKRRNLQNEKRSCSINKYKEKKKKEGCIKSNNIDLDYRYKDCCNIVTDNTDEKYHDESNYEYLKSDSKTTIYEESLKKKSYNCDVHLLFNNFCQFFNCSNNREFMNDETNRSELTLDSNNYKTSDLFCRNELYHELEHINNLEYKTNESKKNSVTCFTESGNRSYSDYHNKYRNLENIKISNTTTAEIYENSLMDASAPYAETNNYETTNEILIEDSSKNEKYLKIESFSKILRNKCMEQEEKKDGKGNLTSYYDSIKNIDNSSLITKEMDNKRNHPIHVDQNVVFIQIENFSRKIDEYISDEKIFRAQKLIDHVKKYIEYYINYFKKSNEKDIVEKLLKYYDKNCTNKNIKYNINHLKVNIILHFLNFFRLNEMASVLNDYCYYFSVDPIHPMNSDIVSDSNENNNLKKFHEDSNANRKDPLYNYASYDWGVPWKSVECFNLPGSGNVSKINSNINNNENSSNNNEDTNNSNNNKDNNNYNNSSNNNNNSSSYNNNYNSSHNNNNDRSNNNNNNTDNHVIVDKIYHQQYISSSLLTASSILVNEQSADDGNINLKSSSQRHMVKIIQKYSKRIKNFRKIKQNKEGWIKENDKYLDLWHRVDSENNISVHVRAKLPYEVNRILSILNETELSVNWAPFLTTAKKLKHLSRASAIITQLYEYPIIGKKESLMYCLGANSLEELGCIILCCRSPPELDKDILFYENMCEKIKINKYDEIIKVKEDSTKLKKNYKEVSFFKYILPDPIPKIDRQRAADLCFLLYPLNNGKSTILELFLHFENEFKYTPIKMVTYFIKKIVKNMYENIIKSCKNYEHIYSDFPKKNPEFYAWLDNQIKKFLKSKRDAKLLDSISLQSYNVHENNE